MNNNNSKNKHILLTALLIVIAHAVLFFLLREKVLITPDFVGSDAFHVNYSLKQYLISSLEQKHFPFWTNLIQGGFPLFAEGQIGALFIPNIVGALICHSSGIYFFLLTVSMLFITLGLFFLFQQEGVPLLVSVLLSFNFAWVGPITFGWVHLNLIQTFSLVPFLYAIYFQWLKTEKCRYGLGFSFLLFQMYCAGTMQIVFITLLSLVVYSLFVKERKQTVLWLILWMGLGTVFALPQLLPSFQLHTLSSRAGFGDYAFAVSVPFKVIHLLGFFSSTYMGTPKNASFPLDWNKQGIYWENTPYVGVLLCIVFIFLFVYGIGCKSNDKKYIAFLFTALLFLLLALGDSSPLYFLFGIFPFTLFRVTGRFLFIAIFFMFLFVGHSIKKTVKSEMLYVCICLLLIINGAHLVQTAFDYHLISDESKLTSSSTLIVHTIRKNSFTYIVGFDGAWTTLLKKGGWSSQKAVHDFLFLYQFPYPNSNLLSGIPSLNQGSVGLTLRRPAIVSTYMDSLLKDKNASPEKKHAMLSLYGVGTVITMNPNKINAYTVDTTLQEHPFSSFYIPKKLKRVEYVSDINAFLANDGISVQSGIVEDHVSVVQDSQTMAVISTKQTDQRIEARIRADKSGFLAFRQNWYPEWKAYIDGKEVPIYKTNITHIGIDVPEGDHTVALAYIPTTFYVGAAIGCGSFIILCTVLMLRKRKPTGSGD